MAPKSYYKVTGAYGAEYYRETPEEAIRVIENLPMISLYKIEYVTVKPITFAELKKAIDK
jgi:hypothetical protein